MIKIEKTVYDKPEKLDGKSVLVMRLWPRGVRKERVDVWMKELGTDKRLIKRWKAGKISWGEFSREYNKSLKGKEDMLKSLANEAKHQTVTLLCNCKDASHCHRYLLKKAIERYVVGISSSRTKNIPPG